MSGHGPGALTTASVALLFAAIFLFGGRAAGRLGMKGRRRFLSIAAGISVAYTFVHVLPALHAIREFQQRSEDSFTLLFPEYSVYLWTMAGFLVFYGLETIAAAPRHGAQKPEGRGGGTGSWWPWVHMGGFAVYTWILTYMLVWTGKGALAVALFTVAMAMHLFTITCSLSTHYQELYDRRGAFLLALASLAGWASAVTLSIPSQVVLALVAFVAGGVVVNAAIAELPREKGGQYWSFLSGATVYTAMLLILSRYE
jgi:hypothetical protein